MPVILATKTLRAIDLAIESDQGNAYRGWLQKILPHMGDAYRQDDAPFRSHMGASSIGRECAREIWYGFRWATARKFEGRMLRLFNRGHLEEARLIAALLTIGCTVHQQDAEGKQFKISAYGGHYGGSGDGVVIGCPDLPAGMAALSEFKTHSVKSFDELAGPNWDKYRSQLVYGLRGAKAEEFKGAGVRAAKFEHYVQVQQYARHMGLGAGLYMAVNKNTDDIYAELVPLDAENADAFTQRAIKVIPLHEPPKRINESAGWFGCKFCDHRPVCHLGAAPARNCRTCEWVTPREDGTWWCEEADINGTEGQRLLSKVDQLAGCASWSKNSKAFR